MTENTDITTEEVQEWLDSWDGEAQARDEVEDGRAIKTHETDEEVGFIVSAQWWYQLAEELGFESKPSNIDVETSAGVEFKDRINAANGKAYHEYPDLGPDYANTPLVIEK